MLFALLDHYRGDQKAARSVAVAGYLHVMKFHRAVSLMDYVLRTVHTHQQDLQKSAGGRSRGQVRGGVRSAVRTDRVRYAQRGAKIERHACARIQSCQQKASGGCIL